MFFWQCFRVARIWAVRSSLLIPLTDFACFFFSSLFFADTNGKDRISCHAKYRVLVDQDIIWMRRAHRVTIACGDTMIVPNNIIGHWLCYITIWRWVLDFQQFFFSYYYSRLWVSKSFWNEDSQTQDHGKFYIYMNWCICLLQFGSGKMKSDKKPPVELLLIDITTRQQWITKKKRDQNLMGSTSLVGLLRVEPKKHQMYFSEFFYSHFHHTISSWFFFLDLQSKEAEQMLVLFPIKSRVDLKLCADERKREKNRLLKPIFFIRHTNKFALSLDIIDSRQPKTAAAAAALRQTRRIDFLHITPNRASLSISHCVN